MKTSVPLPMMSIREKKSLMDTALGKEKADIVIRDARLVNVYTGEIQDDQAVSIRGEWIAYAGKNPDHTIGTETTVIDAGGRTVIPGLIDGHTHLAWLFSPDQFLKHAIAGGTTTVVTEAMEPFPVAGYAGVVDFLDSLSGQPVKIYATAPPMMSISHTARGISQKELAKFLERPDILGLGEAYWQAVLQETDRLLPLFEQTLAIGKCLEGHSAGASEKKLIAYLASGVSSCHEPINAVEVLDRLRLGLYVMIREGSIRRDLEAISRITDTEVSLRRLILVTDGVEPGDLLKKGYMEYVVQKAIDCGFDPVSAVQMATLNVAEHFSLDHLIGGIAPGRQADLLIIPDPRTIKPITVISRGKVIACDGKLLAEPRRHVWSPESLNTVNLPNKLSAEDFSIQAPAGVTCVTARIIELVTELVTRETRMEMTVENGKIPAIPGQDLLKIAAIDRTHQPGKHFVGLLKGFGLATGAVASTAAWDTADIIAIGADDEDMAKAVNRTYDLQGGIVVCSQGKIVAELPLPVFGLMSTLPMEHLAREIESVRKEVIHLGFPYNDPLLTIITLTGQAIPFFRICEEGLVYLKDGRTVDLVVE